ncbi:MAG: selenide, water dikinase SelD [Fimbriimonadales bacterium]|nr:selenide, water dikinase SelD [Fimbriimonadales bacterium]
MAEVLAALPRSSHPNLLVGFDTHDDAGVFRVSEHQALVQTMDFFTPIVDDPYSYGQIAAANALSDVYAMGGRPITAMNICCFDPQMAPAQVWADILRGMADKVAESGAALVGGHSVEDPMPKFGLSVTGLIDPTHMLDNAGAEPGDLIFLSKPLGTGIITSAAKWDDEFAFDSLVEDPVALPQGATVIQDSPIGVAIAWMSHLNREASERALAAGARCATDITGFGLAGHLFNVARSSEVGIEIDSAALPLLPRIQELVERKNLTGGSKKTRAHLGNKMTFADSVPDWLKEVVVDPQTSGGLAIFSKTPIEEFACIGRTFSGTAQIAVR